MRSTPRQYQVLIALFQLCRDTQRVDATTLAQRVGITPTQAAASLVALERAGLCDASRARLTMRGLATAVLLGASSGGGSTRRPQALPERPVPSAEAALPIAALPSHPPTSGSH